MDQAGLKYEISDFDGYALEVGLQLVEKAGSGEVVAICLGPDGVQETLRKALAMGATRAVQLKADEVPFDGFAIASALAAELKDGGYDLILFGRMATDTASGTVGAMTAQLLDLPCVTAISHLELADGAAPPSATSRAPRRRCSSRFPPCSPSTKASPGPGSPPSRGSWPPRRSRSTSQPAQLGKVSLTVESMALPPERSGGRIVGEGPDAVPELVRLLRTEAKVL